jgi:hypothetical protein
MGLEDYLDLSSPDSAPERTFYFIMNCLLYSRLEVGEEPHDGFEDDVNVYLAHLLRSFMDPAYHQHTRSLLSDYDYEVFGRLRYSQDARLKYTVYKTNADFLLVSLGMFSSDHIPPGDQVPRFDHGREGRIGRGKSYYQFAFTFGQQLPANSSAVNEVLRRLAAGFEKYLRILSHLRGEYFNLLSHLSTGEIYHLSRSVDEVQKREVLRRKQDQFLDAYVEWKAHLRPALRSRVMELARELREMDPSFTFNSLD